MPYNALVYYSEDFLKHEAPPGHPENKHRLIAIHNALSTVDFFGLPVLEPREATQKELELAHSAVHIQTVKEAVGAADNLDPDTYTSPGSLKAALKAAGSVIQASESLLEEKTKNAFCLNRPPGHHATRDKSMGFCLFNNIAVGASLLVSRNKRVAILDFDAHHGNGTQDIFYSTDQVLYCSWHQWPHYPGTGSREDVGIGKGKGYSINIPLCAGSGDTDFLNSFDAIAAPALKQFSPDAIMVSAGFDSHKNDPLSSLNFTEDGYKTFYKKTLEYCKQNELGLISCLEGGYDLTSLSSSVLKCLELLSDKI